MAENSVSLEQYRTRKIKSEQYKRLFDGSSISDEWLYDKLVLAAIVSQSWWTIVPKFSCIILHQKRLPSKFRIF